VLDRGSHFLRLGGGAQSGGGEEGEGMSTSAIDRHRQARKMRRTIEVECIGECDIEEFSTEVLRDELARRKVVLAQDEKAEILSAYEALTDRRPDDARWILERMLWPKWQSVEACEKASARKGKG
jgi:hypothetical protein